MSVPEIVRQIHEIIDVRTLMICMAGLTLFGIWLGRTSLGRKALADSRPRRNSLPFYVPFVLLLIWFCSVGLAVLMIERLLPNLPDWQSSLVNNIIISVGAIAVVALAILLARAHFARRLKGLGLNLRTAHKDFAAAFVNLLAVWPFMLAVIILTRSLGKVIFGPEFEMQQHEELELITTYSQLPLRVMVVVVAVVVAPVLEEVLFRGFFQTVLRSFLETRRIRFGIRRAARPVEGEPHTHTEEPAAPPAPAAFDDADPVRSELEDAAEQPTAGSSHAVWFAIVFSSALFAIVHAEPAHWPALFVLGMCLGYAYEKSGSLLRPIFIHAIFNGVTVLFVLHGA
jgi:membrane protease YdiL (CAAX protease family)